VPQAGTQPVAKASKPVGRPRLKIDPKKVERLARYGSPAAEIAAIMGCSPDTLERYFAEPIKRAHENLKHMLRGKLMRKAQEGDTACLIFATKVICGLKEPREDALNVQVNTVVQQNNLKAITPELRQKFWEIDEALRKEGHLISNGNGATDS
jgi:hypothetical protein